MKALIVLTHWFVSLKDSFKCLVGLHEWTSAAQKGIKPTQEQVRAVIRGSLEVFEDYAQMYCARCGKRSRHRFGHIEPSEPWPRQ
jgi:hypothetical protein